VRVVQRLALAGRDQRRREQRLAEQLEQALRDRMLGTRKPMSGATDARPGAALRASHRG
jgi:hypothetical protein